MYYDNRYIFKDHPDAWLTVMLHETDYPAVDGKATRPAMIVCPGGAYLFLTPFEGEPVALGFMDHGFNAFVLHYSVGENASDFNPAVEACLTIKYLRDHAEEFRIDPHRIFILGFSAGGHLAGSAGVFWKHPKIREALGPDAAPDAGRPDGMVMCYPVVTCGALSHGASLDALCGHKDSTPEEQEVFALEKYVDDETPSAFLWHTSTDGGVPVMNSLLFGQALAMHRIPFEMRVYPEGNHGLGLASRQTSDTPHVAGEWMPQAARWALDLDTSKNHF